MSIQRGDGEREAARLEAFSDAVLAVIITIMAFGLNVPGNTTWHAVRQQLPSLFVYMLSFTLVGIYWNNHHHLLRATQRISVGPPVNSVIEIGGRQQFRLDELARNTLRERHDPREVITDPHALYYGAELHERTLVPDDAARLAKTRFDDWLNQSTISNS